MSKGEIRLIGPLRVVLDGQEETLPRSRKARALLAMLALESENLTRASLCAHIWPDTADPRADLRWSLSKLRGVIGAAAIVTSGNLVRLDASQITTDVRRLEEALAENGDGGSASTLREQQTHFAQEPLADLDFRIGVEFELWLESQRQALRRLQQRWLAALIQHLDDEPAEALECARRRVALDPLNEAAVRDLLRLTLRVAGRQQAQTSLEQARARLRHAGLPDSGLLAAWRRLSQGQAAIAVESRVDLPPDLFQALPQKPSVAVLGFDNLGDSEDAMLAEGLAVELTSSLARLSGLFVIARGSASRFRLADTTAPAIGHRLGVRYLVHGSVRRYERRLRVTVDLLECECGEEIWAERFERSLDDLFLVQDQIVDAIVSALEPRIDQAERDRARLLPTENLNAWECFYRAMWHIYRFTPADTMEAHRLLLRALGQDPNFARAHAGLSFSHFSRAFLHTSDDRDADVRQALEHARASVGLQPRDPLGHWSLGRALFLARSHDQALGAIDRALVANSNSALGHYARGFIGCHAGIAREVYGDLDMAQRLSPFDPLLFAMQSCRAISLAVTDRAAEAAAWALMAIQQPNAHVHIHAIAAACLQLDGRAEEASRSVAETQRMLPGYSIGTFEASFPHKSDRDRQVMSQALLAAGLSR